MLRNAVAQAAAWRMRGRHLRVSVNIAAANLEESDFSERVLGYLASAGVGTDALAIELTEGTLIGRGRAAGANSLR